MTECGQCGGAAAAAPLYTDTIISLTEFLPQQCPVSSVQECRVTVIATIATIALQLGMIKRKLARLESKLCKTYLDQCSIKIL